MAYFLFLFKGVPENFDPKKGVFKNFDPKNGGIRKFSRTPPVLTEGTFN